MANLNELWVGWTRDAQSRYVIPEEIEDTDELIDDMAAVATGYADQMLDEYEARFSASERSGGARRRPQPKRGKRSIDREEDPET